METREVEEGLITRLPPLAGLQFVNWLRTRVSFWPIYDSILRRRICVLEAIGRPLPNFKFPLEEEMPDRLSEFKPPCRLL